MTSSHNRPRIDPELRRRAEEVDQRSAAQSPEDIGSLSSEEIRQKFHELRVHQIELEMQNHQLRQAQLALAASQTRYFDLYDMAPVGYCTVSRQGLLMEANLKAANLLGLARTQLVGQRFSRFILTEDNDVYYLLRNKLFETSELQSCELRMVQADGTTFWAHLSITLAQDESSTPVSWLILSDITERKQAEAVLHRKQAMLARTEKIARLGSWEWDVATDTVAWSDELFRIFQLEPAERAPSFAEQSALYHPADMEQLKSAVEAAVNKGTSYELELRALRKDGTTRVCLARGQVEVDQGGRATRLVGSLQDITERKMAEEVLQANRKQLSDIIKFLPNATFAIDKEGRVIIWNEAIEEMTGISASEMLGKTDYAHSVPFYGVPRPQLLNLVLEDCQEIATRYPHITREGDNLVVEVYCSSLYNNKGAWVFAKAAPLHDQDGNVIGAIESVRDITNRRLAETYGAIGREALHRLNEPGDLRHSIQAVLAVLKTGTGFDAVGIRLQEGEDYPYFVQDGFPSDFLLKENSLVERAADGGVCRDKDGKVRLECTCGLVIGGKIDSAQSFFTPGGSFWVNDSHPILEIPSWDDPRHNPRHQCMHYNYASVALVPIRNKERIIGLIQFNDRRKGCFSLNSVELLEGIAAHIGEALMRKQTEDALRKSEARYAETLSVVETGLWDWHVPSGQAIFSTVYYQMLGYEDGEFPATYNAWRGLIHPDDIERVDKELSLCVESGEGFSIDLRMKTKSGSWCWVSTRGKAIDKDSDCKAVRMLGTLSDISERKRAEKEAQNLQAQLLQAQKMEAIGTLAGGIAHDFNNILGAILGYSEIVSELVPSESIATEYLDKVMKASQRAASLVKQILAFSRQANIERVPLKPSHIVEEAIKLLRPSLPSTITINLSIDTANRLILADPTQVHQILMNLCTNAFHAMEQTGGILEIILEDRELSHENLRHQLDVQPGKFVLLSVGDTGGGIESEILDKIFDPYFTTKEVGKGTGLGLAISHGILASYGGFITCESEIGRGTVFRVFFPAIEEVIVPEVKSVDAVVSPGTERILLVDDEKMLGDLGKTMLERQGYEVTALTSSLEALAIFQNQPELFDAIVTDQTMPGMTGIELSRKILQIRPEIPIILCTGYSTLIYKEQAELLGIKGFVDKPMTKKEITTLLRKVLDDKV